MTIDSAGCSFLLHRENRRESSNGESAVVANCAIRLGGRDLVLDSTEVLLKDIDGRSDRTHVWAGLDLFKPARAATIDFRAMRLTAE